MQANAAAKAKSFIPLKKIQKVWRLYVLIALPLLYIIIFKYMPMYGARSLLRTT